MTESFPNGVSGTTVSTASIDGWEWRAGWVVCVGSLRHKSLEYSGARLRIGAKNTKDYEQVGGTSYFRAATGLEKTKWGFQSSK